MNENLSVERVKITNEEGEKAIGKPKGNYITIDIRKLKIKEVSFVLLKQAKMLTRFLN